MTKEKKDRWWSSCSLLEPPVLYSVRYAHAFRQPFRRVGPWPRRNPINFNFCLLIPLTAFSWKMKIHSQGYARRGRDKDSTDGGARSGRDNGQGASECLLMDKRSRDFKNTVRARSRKMWERSRFHTPSPFVLCVLKYSGSCQTSCLRALALSTVHG